MKWAAWILRLIITVLIVSLLTVMTTGYVVNWYVQSLLSSYHIPVQIQAPSVGSVMKGLLGLGSRDSASIKGIDKGKGTGDDNNTRDLANKGLGDDLVHEADELGTEGSGETDPELDIHTEEEIPEDALPVMGGTVKSSAQKEGLSSTGSSAGGPSVTGSTPTGSSTAGSSTREPSMEPSTEDLSHQDSSLADSSAQGSVTDRSSLDASSSDRDRDQVVVITPDDLLQKKDELTADVKEEIFQILMTKLPEDEMQYMTEAMEDGLTESEMIRIQQVLSMHLDKEQYQKVMEFIKK